MPRSLQCSMQCYVVLDHVITSVDCEIYMCSTTRASAAKMLSIVTKHVCNVISRPDRLWYMHAAKIARQHHFITWSNCINISSPEVILIGSVLSFLTPVNRLYCLKSSTIITLAFLSYSSKHRNGTDNWNRSSWKTLSRLLYINHIAPGDHLTTQGALSLAVIVVFWGPGMQNSNY